MQKRGLVRISFYAAVALVLGVMIFASYLEPIKTGQYAQGGSQAQKFVCSCPVWGPLIGKNECDDEGVTTPQLCSKSSCTNWATGRSYSCNSPVSCPTTCPQGKPAYASNGRPLSPYVAWCTLKSTNCPATANYQCPTGGCTYSCKYLNGNIPQPAPTDPGGLALPWVDYTPPPWTETANCGPLPPIEW